ncbi:MAG: hypothetical protein O3A95_11030 [Planctomycetota bacterium]|nr:hypothetical protein [Planctomycetota bacterium]
MASPSPLPSSLDSSQVWQNVRLQWRNLDSASSDFLERSYQLVRPYVLDAVRRVGLNYCYLLQESDVVVRLMPQLAAKEELPSRFELFRIFLDSSILRITHTDLDALTCDLRDPLAPWVDFRQRVNGLRRSFRRYFFAFLPSSELAPTVPGIQARKPGSKWTDLWDSLTESIPAGCLPEGWQETRASAVVNSEPVFFTASNLLLPRTNVSEQLGEILHRAAGLAESNRVGRTKLELPKGVIPRDAVAFSVELQSLLNSSGGMPQSDPALKAALNSILDLRLGDKNCILKMKPEALVDCSEEAGFNPFKTFMLRGSILDRAGDSNRALWEFHKGVRAAGSRKQIGQSLANLAIQALVVRDFARAKSWILEAWQYSPDCSFVASCKTYIELSLATQDNQRGENIA